MNAYDLSQIVTNYFIGLENRKNQETLERYTRVLRTGDKCRRCLGTLETERVLRFASNTLINLIQLYNLVYSIKSGYPQLEYALIAETSRFLINRLFDSSTSKKIRGFKKELSQMKHESWDKILKDSARRLDERT